MDIENKINNNSQSSKATEDHTASIAYNLGLKELDELNYSSAYSYFLKAHNISHNHLVEDLYLHLHEISYSLGFNDKS